MSDPVSDEPEFSEETTRRAKSKLQELNVDPRNPTSYEGIYTCT
jgi:hypothetical protein